MSSGRDGHRFQLSIFHRTKIDGLPAGKTPAGGSAPLPAAPPCRRLPDRPARCATMNRHGHPAHSDAVSPCRQPRPAITFVSAFIAASCREDSASAPAGSLQHSQRTASAAGRAVLGAMAR